MSAAAEVGAKAPSPAPTENMTLPIADFDISDLQNAKGRLGSDARTATELLIRDGRLAGVLVLDEFADQERKVISLRQAFGDPCASPAIGPVTDDDLMAVTIWLKCQWGIDVPLDKVAPVVRRWARATPINPIVDRLEKLRAAWDGKTRLASWLEVYAGAKATSDEQRRYIAEIGKRFLIGITARAYIPGTKQDQMLILKGPQGSGKSTAVQVLAQAIDDSCFLDGFTLTGNKDDLMLLAGVLICEWGELAGLSKREDNATKSFLSRTADTYRSPFARLAQKHPRTTSFFGTTNETTFLRDTSGNRRYWPVVVGKADLAGMRAIAGQLWGEAAALYHSGSRWWCDRDAPDDAWFRVACDQAQCECMVADALDDRALDLADELVAGGTLDGVKATDSMSFPVSVMQRAMFPGVDQVPAGEWIRATAALRRTGWTNDKVIEGRRRWRLSEVKAMELRRRHGVPEPEAKHGLRKRVKAELSATA